LIGRRPGLGLKKIRMPGLSLSKSSMACSQRYLRHLNGQKPTFFYNINTPKESTMTTAEQCILKFYQAINIHSQNDNIQHHIKVNNNQITHQEANTRGIYLDANNKCSYKWRRLNTRNIKAISDANITWNST
jgi:hypothetical protein